MRTNHYGRRQPNQKLSLHRYPGELSKIERAIFASIGFRYLSVAEHAPKGAEIDEAEVERLKERILQLEEQNQKL